MVNVELRVAAGSPIVRRWPCRQPERGGHPMSTSAEEKTITGEELGRLVGLIKESDSVELKLTVPESDQLAVVRALEMDPLEAQIRQVFFFETPELALNDAGVVVRARRAQKKGDDTVVKLRPV